MKFINSKITQIAYLGKHAQNLEYTCSDQVKEIYQQRGIIIPVIASSTLECVSRNEGASLADISKTLDIPHQLVAQRLEKLLKLNLVKKRSDPNDKRRTAHQLTPTGKEQAHRLKSCMEDLSVIYEDVFTEIGCDLSQMLVDAIDALNRKSLANRFSERFPLERQANA